MSEIDPVKLTVDLIKCPSVTPDEGGAIALIEDLLKKNGFSCYRISRGGVENLFARWGSGKLGNSFAYNGHTDVVPVGNFKSWSVDPFGAEIKSGYLFGRGATDMKSSVAAFVSAAIDFVAKTPPDGSIVITITGDEEGEAKNGTSAILDWMRKNDENISHCLVGEPTCPEYLGEMVKIGRRGSVTAKFCVKGSQGHTAYPALAVNPLNALVRLMDALTQESLDHGSEHFDPSTLAITTIDTGNFANNVIPEKSTAKVNIRFNDNHTGESIRSWLEKTSKVISKETGTEITVDAHISGESFVTVPGYLSDIVCESIQQELGVKPVLSTTGGTSDARFIKNVCPVVEFGLVGKTMHAIDERVEISQIRDLKKVYMRILENYFAEI
jgi:succinyl-diaminopimelate desuccinylase